MKTLIIVLLFSALGLAQSWQTVAIDTGETTSDSLNVGNDRIVSVSVPFVWTTANITFQKWDFALAGWYTVKDKDGNAITLTITSPPANYGLKPIDSWLLTGILRIVSSAAQTNGAALSYETGRFE